ncbi:gastrula zinc finger protein XlCGF28.1-like [Lampris incognitus]|uniref:gastrula zinc finger protein XlCGF28.1-like n=1 Tax=Lampris incognitus TaxID=2546036 RepID=UPI0024B52AB7|nr:gastrula zinc finger protein XlCGF28.1-like [Lampris incognitus]
MSKINLLRSFVIERLTAAAEEILGAFERTIAEYEDERERQRRLLDMVLKPRITLHRIDYVQVSHQQHHKQERSPTLAKEEQQELWISPQEDHLPLQEVADTSESIFTPLCDGNDDSKDQPLSSQLYQTQTEGDTKPPAVPPFELIQLDVKEENLLISEPTSDHHTLSNYCYVTKSEADHTCSHLNCAEADSTWKARLKPHKKPNKCKICGKVLYNLEIFKSHMTFHTGEKPFKCTTCGRDFTWKCNMERHTRTHAGEEPFRCTTCRKMFTDESRFQRHIRTHTGEKPFRCTMCGKMFTQKSSFQRHVRTHTGEKPFRCTTCGKMFTQKSSFQRHIRTHTGEKPFRCTMCGEMFTRKSSLEMHVRIHTGERPFRCTTCGKMFTRKSHLRTHVKTHTGEKPFRCTMCGKMFTRKSSLQMHVRSHTGEKPFRCNMCGKMFTRNSDLQMHVRTHTGEKPFRCTTCGKMFTRKSHLLRHMRTHIQGRRHSDAVIVEMGSAQNVISNNMS